MSKTGVRNSGEAPPIHGLGGAGWIVSRSEKERVQMRGMTRRFCDFLGSVGVVLAAVCLFFTLAPNLSGQEQQEGDRFYDPGLNTKVLPPGGPTPRLPDGKPNLTGRYYPNGLGRMIGSYTPNRDELEPGAGSMFDRTKTPQENPVFRPETKDKYQDPTPYGICAPGGTPTSITTQATEHGPIELIHQPGVLWILSEFPLSVRRIPTDGSPHPADPDVSFAGDSRAHWEGDTLVVDTIAIDTRMRNISVGATGDRNAWTHSEQEHVIERFSRPSKNFLTYQLTVTDPVVLTKPFQSAPYRWSLAQSPEDVWTEYLCTANEDADAWKEVDPEHRENYDKGLLGGGGEQTGAETGGRGQ
jgi:hypothetical protein